MLGYFKKALYNVSLNFYNPDSSLIYNFAKLFYDLDYSDNRSVSTQRFIDSFEWVKINEYNQQDVGEFNSKFEEELDKTDIRIAFKYLFKGSIRSTIKCIDENYESSRCDEFTNLQLTINVNIYNKGL
jgi:ubiquitin carboxyl-terminal hydrolase 7